MRRLALCLALASAGLALAAFQSVSVSAVAGKAKSGKAPVTLAIKIPDGYHIYGAKASTGIPTTIKVKGTDFKVAKMTFPKPKTITVVGEKMEVYEDKVSIPVVIQATKKLKGKQKVSLQVTTQACNDRVCLPADTKTVAVNIDFGN